MNKDYLLANAQLQDSLLQSYRAVSLTVQTILLMVGTVLLTSILNIDKQAQNVIFYSMETLTVILFFIALYISRKFFLVIKHRANDVSYWHEKIIADEVGAENDKMFFTKFKIWQKLKREDSECLSDMQSVSRDELLKRIEGLVEKGSGHTRKVVDKNISICIIFVWCLLIVIGIINHFT